MDSADRQFLSDQAAELQAAGWSYREMSHELGIPTTTLHRWLAAEVEGSNRDARGGLGIALAVAAAVGVVIWIARGGKQGG